MTEFQDISAYLAPTLDLPVAGKVYRVPSPPAAVGLRLQAAWAVQVARRAGQEPKQAHLTRLVDDPGTTLEQDALGPVYDEMVADGVTLEALNHAGMTAYLWIVAGERAARAWWVTPSGEATGSGPDQSTSTSTDVVSTTKPQGSTSGTRSPRKKSSGSKPKAKG